MTLMVDIRIESLSDLPPTPHSLTKCHMEIDAEGCEPVKTAAIDMSSNMNWTDTSNMGVNLYASVNSVEV